MSQGETMGGEFDSRRLHHVNPVPVAGFITLSPILAPPGHRTASFGEAFGSFVHDAN